MNFSLKFDRNMDELLLIAHTSKISLQNFPNNGLILKSVRPSWEFLSPTYSIYGDIWIFNVILFFLFI